MLQNNKAKIPHYQNSWREILEGTRVQVNICVYGGVDYGHIRAMLVLVVSVSVSHCITFPSLSGLTAGQEVFVYVSLFYCGGLLGTN